MSDLTSDLADVRAALDERMPVHRADLEALVRIPSISADPAAALLATLADGWGPTA